MKPRDLPSFNAVKITRQTSPNQAPIDKRGINTIFNHFRDKPARYLIEEGRANAPSEAFQAVLKLAEQVLNPNDWAAPKSKAGIK
jgi:hypothetical protein